MDWLILQWEMCQFKEGLFDEIVWKSILQAVKGKSMVSNFTFLAT